MRYKIVVTKIEEKEEVTNGEFTVVDEIPWTEEMLDGERMYGSVSDFLKNTPLKKVRAYAPSKTIKVKEEVKILEQTVDDLNLHAVIMAINDL